VDGEAEVTGGEARVRRALLMFTGVLVWLVPHARGGG